MALKQKIDKAAYALLSPVLQAEYKADGDTFVLDVTDLEDVGALKRAKDREVEEAKTARANEAKAKADLAALQATLADGATLDARKKGDIETLEKSWQSKLDTGLAEVNTKLTAREAFIKTQLVDSVAVAMASRLSKTPNVLLPHIKNRLAADLTGDAPATRVLDASGAPSALSVAELEKEFAGNPDFAAIIIASSGSGGGAAGGKQTGGSGAKKLAEMSGVERVAYQKADPAGFARESAASRSAGPQI